MLPAASLNRRITLQRRAAGQDAAGQPLSTWEAVAETWASIRHPSGAETIAAGAEVATLRASIRIRWRTGLDAGMRVLADDGLIYHIKSPPIPGGAQGREWLDLVCEAVQ